MQGGIEATADHGSELKAALKKNKEQSFAALTIGVLAAFNFCHGLLQRAFDGELLTGITLALLCSQALLNKIKHLKLLHYKL